MGEDALARRPRSRPRASSPSSAATHRIASPSSPTAKRTQPTCRRPPACCAKRRPHTDNASLKKFLNLRADAFLSNDYYASDVAWMDLDSPLDITIGPYETYNDELFGYKAAFEAYINIRDEKEPARLQQFSSRLQEVENNLPIDPRYRNPKLGASAPSAW